jgi:hypothetical protein
VVFQVPMKISNLDMRFAGMASPCAAGRWCGA